MDLKEDVESLLNIKIPNMNKDEIIMIYKTSSLFSFCFILGAIYSLDFTLNLDDFRDMGYSLGIMYQLMDDFKDKDNLTETNYVLKYGYARSMALYTDNRIKLIELLQKNKLFTIELQSIIHLMDEKITFSE